MIFSALFALIVGLGIIGQWAFVGMFAVLLLLALVSIALVI